MGAIVREAIFLGGAIVRGAIIRENNHPSGQLSKRQFSSGAIVLERFDKYATKGVSAFSITSIYLTH